MSSATREWTAQRDSIRRERNHLAGQIRRSCETVAHVQALIEQRWRACHEAVHTSLNSSAARSTGAICPSAFHQKE
jgi:hypothetical protein